MAKCVICGKPATKKVIWADGRGYQPSCDADVKATQDMLTKKNGAMTELAGVQDLSDSVRAFKTDTLTIDLVSSRAYPDLERKPGGPDNWVERAGGLPSYIERIAKHLHYERGYTISRAIASAVNTVKRWAHMGKVAKYGDPNHKRVSAATAAKAAKAVAEWTAKKAAGKINLSDVEEFVIELTDLDDAFCIELAEEIESIDLSKYDRMGTGAAQTERAILSSMNLADLADRANKIADPAARGAARARVLELAWGTDMGEVLDLASTIAPRNARGRASDGRRSYKGQGKWKHGFVPANKAAKEAKSKGSPIAMKRMNRLFGKNKAADDSRKPTREVQSNPPKATRKSAGPPPSSGRSGSRSASGRKNDRPSKSGRITVDEKSDPGSESANDLGRLRKSNFAPRAAIKDQKAETRKEASKDSRVPARAKQNWDEIPENLKTVRNGKRFVLAQFGGKGYVTEWLGGVNEVKQTSFKNRKVMRTLSSADASNMSQSELRGLVNNPKIPESVKRTARKALRSIAKEPNRA